MSFDLEIMSFQIDLRYRIDLEFWLTTQTSTTFTNWVCNNQNILLACI